MSLYVYLIIAISCFVGEMFTMEFSLACLGLGALGAGVSSWLGFGIWGQVFAFTVISVIGWTGIRPFALKHLYGKSKHIKTPAEEVIGKDALVESAINPVTDEGRVKVDGESWKATAEGPLPEGTVCIVEKLEGVTLFVKAK